MRKIMPTDKIEKERTVNEEAFMPTIIYLPYNLSVITATTQNTKSKANNKTQSESDNKATKFTDFLNDAEKKLNY